MRVIAGEFRGRPLVRFKAPHIRPTTGRVKEAIFNKLAAYWPEARVLDLFAGTGSLSIEAISRGAQSVVAVEKHKRSLAVLKQNRQQFQVESRLKLVGQDVFQFLRSTTEAPFDVILIDPPFTERLADEVMRALSQSPIFTKDSVVALESSAQEPLESDYQPFELWDQKSYSDKYLSYFSIRE